VFEAALADMRKAGAIIVDPVRVDLAAIPRDRGAGACGGFKYDMNRYLAGLGANAPQKNLEAIVRSRQFHPTVAQRLQSGQEGSENGPDTPACQAEMKYRAAFRAAVEDVMNREKLDAFVYPTWSNVPRLIGDLNTPHGDNSQLFSPTSGNPAVNVPMGYTRGNTLPIGVTFFGRAWDEPTLIRLAYAYEWATKHRRPPVLSAVEPRRR
jgi:amidase